jgi:predicted dehydrogenase
MLSRRNFLKAGVASGAAIAFPYVLGAEKDKKYRIALIGTGWWGMNITREAIKNSDCKIVAMCDVDKNILDPASGEIEKLTGNAPDKYKDYRELLDKVKPDIVINATPDHWHALITIAACKAGADVYVEKPISHTILEGKAMVKAARDNERIVQVGTHRRVSPHCISAHKFLKDGNLGKIGMVRTFVHSDYGQWPDPPDEKPPEGLDWDFWCGPAPLRAYNKRIHPRGFRQFLDYANGQLADWGIHWLDQVMWWTEEKYPKSIYSTGSKRITSGIADAPDTQVVVYEFDSFTCTWEHRFYAGNEAEKHSIGCYFYGTKGTLHLGWHDGWTYYPPPQDEHDHHHEQPSESLKMIHEEPKTHTRDAHNIPELWADFMDAIKTRRKPLCDIEIGHRSTNMSLLGMLSMKHGKSIKWDGDKEMVIGDEDANKLLRRDYRRPWVYPEV